eukprot:14396142-Ditylum_brightwellii.AAC.1
MDEESMDDMDLKYINAQLMRIIVPSSTNGTKSAYIYGNKNSRGGSNQGANNVHYSRLLWDRNVELRDNGAITIGT